MGDHGCSPKLGAVFASSSGRARHQETEYTHDRTWFHFSHTVCANYCYGHPFGKCWQCQLRLIQHMKRNIVTCPLTTVPRIKQTSQPSLSMAYSIWSRLEMTIFFVQETSMNAVYIWQARKLLHSSSVLTPPGTSKRTLVLHHLIASNLLVIILDAALLGIQFASFFNLQGSFKPLVYGIKLKVEFAILNRLVQSVQRERKGSGDSSGNMWFGRGGNSGPRSRPFHESTKNYSARPEAHGEEIGMVPLRTTTGIWPNHSHDSQNLMIMGNAESPETHDTRYRGQQQIS